MTRACRRLVQLLERPERLADLLQAHLLVVVHLEELALLVRELLDGLAHEGARLLEPEALLGDRVLVVLELQRLRRRRGW